MQYLSGKILDQLMYTNFMGSASFPLMRKKYLEEIGGFDVLLQSAQDYDVWLRLAEKYEVNYVDEVLVTYYIHSGDQITKNYKKRISGQKRIIEKNYEYLKLHKEPYSVKLTKLAFDYAGDKQYSEAMKCWINAVVLCPLRIFDNLRCLYSIHKLYFIK